MSKISLQDLLEEKTILEKKLTILNLMIDAYSDDNFNIVDFDSPIEFTSKMIETKEVPYDDFPYHKKWLEQILYLLDKKGRFLSNHELAESLMPYYHQYNIDRLKRKVSVNISAAYKNETVDGLIKFKINNTPKGNVWGYKKWLNTDGKIIEKYRPFETKETSQMTIY
ncbi:hypothetical protein KIM67_10195 [Flagellimonas sp. 389]|uniref:hypothetical protein n=1 Tax=Flagellimonas sp. 389 TaxID=2835862 RepID=UPI001BD5E8FF|nr:hypothetical protein [Flagellimonas sp. 389]MBS9462783.1 hypothetical protein [Flagellimonas sp. 389]